MYVRVITHSVVCTRGTPPSYRLEYRCVHICMCNNLLIDTDTDLDVATDRCVCTAVLLTVMVYINK